MSKKAWEKYREPEVDVNLLTMWSTADKCLQLDNTVV